MERLGFPRVPEKEWTGMWRRAVWLVVSVEAMDGRRPEHAPNLLCWGFGQADPAPARCALTA